MQRTGPLIMVVCACWVYPWREIKIRTKVGREGDGCPFFHPWSGIVRSAGADEVTQFSPHDSPQADRKQP